MTDCRVVRRSIGVPTQYKIRNTPHYTFTYAARKIQSGNLESIWLRLYPTGWAELRVHPHTTHGRHPPPAGRCGLMALHPDGLAAPAGDQAAPIVPNPHRCHFDASSTPDTDSQPRSDPVGDSLPGDYLLPFACSSPFVLGPDQRRIDNCPSPFSPILGPRRAMILTICPPDRSVWTSRAVSRDMSTSAEHTDEAEVCPARAHLP